MSQAAQRIFHCDLSDTAENFRQCLKAYAPIRSTAEVQSARQAAVLVPLVLRPTGPTVLFTKRTAHLRTHGGQVSFPGGKAEPQDKGAVFTALRETSEEIGLGTDQVEVIGRLDTCTTLSDFRIVPIVGLVTPPFDLRPDPGEVAGVFEVPLESVIEQRLIERKRTEHQGRLWEYYALNWQQWHIYGATAGILKNLVDIVSRGKI